mgnify:CR=1 FL=1
MSSNIRVQRICLHCGGEFTAKTTVTKYCRDDCAKRAYKARKRAEKVEVSNSETLRLQLQPIEILSAKDFLSVSEAIQLLGISKQTMYRMMKRGAINYAKFGSRTIIRRVDLNVLFEPPQSKQPQPVEHDIENCYNLTEIQERFNISEKALYVLLKRNEIPKLRKGKFAYVPKTAIHSLLSSPTIIKDNDQGKIEKEADYRQSA